MRLTRRPVFVLIEVTSSSSRRSASRLDSRATQRYCQPRTARRVNQAHSIPADPSTAAAAAAAARKWKFVIMLGVLVDERLGWTGVGGIGTITRLGSVLVGRLLILARRSAGTVPGRR